MVTDSLSYYGTPAAVVICSLRNPPNSIGFNQPRSSEEQILRPIFVAMDDLDLARRLKRLKRTVLILQSELRHEHIDEKLLAEIDAQLEQGIATEPRSAKLRDHVDSLRENTMIPRPELYSDCIRACEKLMDACEEILDRLG